MSLTAALAYARHGIPVLPVHEPAAEGGCSCGRPGCDRPGKHPLPRHGLRDATTDPRQIEMWCERRPTASLGLVTGVVMDVADVDSVTGWHALRHLCGGAMPVGPQVRTGGGGWHFWFRPLGYGNRVRLLPGLDWRGAGGYVVAPPSRHVSGSAYTWVHRPGGGVLPAASDALRDLVRGPAYEPPGGAIGHPERYAEVALTASAERVANASVGTRNDTLNRQAFRLGRLVGAGLLTAADVRRELEIAAWRCGLGRAETRATIRSGLTAGMRCPIDVDGRGVA